MSTPNDALNALVATAMMQALDQQKRDELIRSALESLVTKRDAGAYGRRPTSPLQDAFEYAVAECARKIIGEMLETEKVRKQVSDLCAAAFEKMALDDGELASGMARAIIEAIRRS